MTLDRIAVAILILPFQVQAGKLVVRILDETASPTAARVYLTGPDGNTRVPDGTIPYNKARNGFSEVHFVPPAGRFDIDLPPGLYQVGIERGKEYVPVKESLAVPAAGRVEKTFRLRRWVWMSDRDWYSADMHPHRPLRDMAALMEAEDLNVALPITRWRALQRGVVEDPDLQAFLEKTDRNGIVTISRRRWFTVLNEELETRSSALLVSRLGQTGTSLEYPLASYGRAERQRGPLVDSEKATSLELPAIAAQGGCDFVGLANNHFWRSGYFSRPWGAWPDRMLRSYPRTCAGFATAGFEMYYALLNIGFPLKLSAGSASGVHPVPLGWSRIYVHVENGFTPENWFRALRSGRSFVTTGPMLLLKVNGHEPGEEFRGEAFPMNAETELIMLSLRPVASAEVVVNGDVHRVKLAAEPGRPYLYRGRTQLTLTSSSWIAARWLEEGDLSCDLAHTSPVYFWDRSAPVPVRRSEVEYLLRRVESLIEEVRTGVSETGGGPTTIESGSASLRDQTLQRFREALEVYRLKLRDAR